MLSPSNSGHVSVMQHCVPPRVDLLVCGAQADGCGQYVGGGSKLTLGSSRHFLPANTEQKTTPAWMHTEYLNQGVIHDLGGERGKFWGGNSKRLGIQSSPPFLRAPYETLSVMTRNARYKWQLYYAIDNR